MSQSFLSNPNKTLQFGLLAALFVLVFFFGRSYRKEAEVVTEPNDAKFKQMEEVIKAQQKSLLDSIKVRYSLLEVESRTITINHQNLNNDLHTVSSYRGDRGPLLDSLLKVAGYK